MEVHVTSSGCRTWGSRVGSCKGPSGTGRARLYIMYLYLPWITLNLALSSLSTMAGYVLRVGRLILILV